MNSILRDTFDGFIMLKSLCIPFLHFLDCIFLVHFGKYLYYYVQNDSYDQNGATNNEHIKLSIIANWFIILTIISESIAWSLIVLFANLLTSPVSLFDILDKGCNSFSKSLSNFSYPSACTTTCPVSLTTRDEDKKKIEKKSLYKH